MARAADAAASETDYQRRKRRRDLGAVVTALAPLLIGFWVIAGLGVSVSFILATFDLFPGLQDSEVLATLVAFAGMLLWAGGSVCCALR